MAHRKVWKTIKSRNKRNSMCVPNEEDEPKIGRKFRCLQI